MTTAGPTRTAGDGVELSSTSGQQPILLCLLPGLFSTPSKKPFPYLSASQAKQHCTKTLNISSALHSVEWDTVQCFMVLCGALEGQRGALKALSGAVWHISSTVDRTVDKLMGQCEENCILGRS